jgi:hypothetical protein
MCAPTAADLVGKEYAPLRRRAWCEAPPGWSVGRPGTASPRIRDYVSTRTVPAYRPMLLKLRRPGAHIAANLGLAGGTAMPLLVPPRSVK